MSIVIVDARGWQNTLDLKTGEKTDARGPVAEMVRDVLRKHPYPGDMDAGSNGWVSDTALDLIDRYTPRFVFLTYAAQYFSGRYTPMTKEVRERMIAEAFLEAERFVRASGFAALVVGTGDMTPLEGWIDVTGIEGLAFCTHWSNRYAGLYGPSPADMKVLGENPHIERIVPRQEVVDLFGGSPGEGRRVPEYLMLARKGYAFRTITDLMRMPVMISSFNFHVPLHAPGRTATAITGIRRILEEDLPRKNVALIVMEGVGLDEFPWPHVACGNGKDWFYYEPGEAQYVTIASGRHRLLDYPTGHKNFSAEVKTPRDYPFSGHFKSIPEETFAGSFPGRSIAVGNKSMFMHMVTGTDVSVECFARNLHNQGTMAVIHRQDKP